MNYLRKISDCPVYDNVVSPFAFYENEVFVKTEPSSTRVFLSDLDQLILVIVNKLLYTTSNQIILVLRRDGVIDEPCFIQKRLRKLVDAEYLVGARFENTTDPQKHSSNKVYRLGWRGAAFLNHNHIKPRLGHYLDSLHSHQVKKILAVNQFLVYTGRDFEDFSLCEPVCVPSGTRNTSTNQIFRSQARLQTDEGIVFIEAIRQQPDWKAEMEEKLTRMGHILRAFTSEQDCSILLIGENEDHMKEIMTCFKSCFDTYPVNVIYTADTLTYTDPKNCLYSFRTKGSSILDWFFREA